jgi:hypothetical protein
MRFDSGDWKTVPDKPGVYIIYDTDTVLYVGMAGCGGSGSLRKRLKDHSTGQVVNMFAQYLFLARVQFRSAERITHPRAAKSACRAYIAEWLLRPRLVKSRPTSNVSFSQLSTHFTDNAHGCTASIIRSITGSRIFRASSGIPLRSFRSEINSALAVHRSRLHREIKCPIY